MEGAGWAAEVPIGSAVYLGLDPLNHSLGLITRILNGEKDGRGFERRHGEGGIERRLWRSQRRILYRNVLNALA